jgi:predicted TIM-barrel fold metal-dependent hydrolase
MLLIDAYCTLGTERDTALEADHLLRQMRQANIGRAVIAPEDREIALFNDQGNRRIAAIARSSGGAFIPACSVNPWHGVHAADLLHSAVADGAKMLILAPALQGFILGDELADPLLNAAGSLHLPVYVHTGPHSAAAPTQLALLALRLPNVRFILAHCGSTDYAWDMPAILRHAPPNLWFELSFVRPWGLPAYAALIDESRLIFGSSAPRNDPAHELRFFNESWPIAEHPQSYGDNLARLLQEVST